MNLFLNQNNKKFYVQSDNWIKCNHCSQEVSNPFIFRRSWGKKRFSEECFCFNCITKQKKPLGIICEAILAYYTDVIPDDCIAIPPMPPFLSEGKTSVFDAATSNNGIESDASGCVIIDRCKLGNTPTHGGWDESALEDKRKALERVKETDRIVKVEEVSGVLEGLKCADAFVEIEQVENVRLVYDEKRNKKKEGDTVG